MPPDMPAQDLRGIQDATRDLMYLYPPLDSSGPENNAEFCPFRRHEGDCLVTRIQERVANGSPEGAMAILIHHLPNLKILRMTMSREGNIFESLLYRIAVDYGDPAKAPGLPFQRLRTVSLCHCDTEGCVSPNWALPYLCIPSIRTFAANVMGSSVLRKGRSTGLILDRPPRPRSNIEEFFFVDCRFDAAAIEHLISSTQVLKRFTYTAGGCIVDDSLYGAKVILNALSEYAQNSLESLVFHHDSYTEEEVCYFFFCKYRQLTQCSSSFVAISMMKTKW
jgi:hypothetical protein